MPKPVGNEPVLLVELGLRWNNVIEGSEWSVWAYGTSNLKGGSRLAVGALQEWERTKPELHLYISLVLQQLLYGEIGDWDGYYEADVLLDQFGDVKNTLAGVGTVWVGKTRGESMVYL